MALCHVHFNSAVLGKAVSMNVILPDGGKPPFATYYLLHGLGDDHTIWQRRTRVEVYANAWPMIVVMPDGLRGFYTTHHQGPDYAKYIAEEVVGFVDRTFPAKRSRSARCIGGLSMGGYGALRLGLGYPETFASVNAHSGALMYGHINPRAMKDSVIPLDDRLRIFGPKSEGTDHDLIALARRLKSSKQLPKIRIDCGVDDFLLDQNRALHQQFEALRIPHEYEEFPGAHNWDYWEQHIAQAIAFHAANLRLKRL